MGKHRRETLGYATEAQTQRRVRPPLYATVLGLRSIAPGPLLCFCFLEGAVGIAVIGALTGLVSWWGVLVLPLAVAAMVKFNDVVAGVIRRPPAAE